MFRSTAMRLFAGSLRQLTRPKFINPARFCTSTVGQTSNPNPNTFQFNTVDPYGSSKTTSSFTEDRRHVTDFKDEQIRVLQASLTHVNKLGWSEAALVAGAREVEVSPSIIGSIDRKEAALVEYFMDVCLERLIDIIMADVELKNLIPSERISKLVKIRLEMQAPYIKKWAQALSIQALPPNLPASFKQRAALVDEIWHAAGDETSDLDWYVKRTVLGGIYSTTEVYMLTDNSPDFRDTWAFLDSRIRDAFDLKKSLQEAQKLAEAVSAGFGGSFQGLLKGVFK